MMDDAKNRSSRQATEICFDVFALSPSIPFHSPLRPSCLSASHLPSFHHPHRPSTSSIHPLRARQPAPPAYHQRTRSAELPLLVAWVLCAASPLCQPSTGSQRARCWSTCLSIHPPAAQAPQPIVHILLSTANSPLPHPPGARSELPAAAATAGDSARSRRLEAAKSRAKSRRRRDVRLPHLNGRGT